ncbi:MAG: dihydrodipicolinate synthase family protein [Bacteroidota bacterium]
MLKTKMKDGFYPALGTPTNAEGSLVKDSFSRQIELMIGAGAKGVLCMGSMGKMATISNREYPVIAKQSYDIVNKKIPLMIGVMDCSIVKILDRIDSLGEIDIEGVVATTPFYNTLNSSEIVNFFTVLAKKSKYPVYIYDLPGVTQSPITLSQLRILMKAPNIAGIKTGNINLILELSRNNLLESRNDFTAFYSNLDLFDVAIKSGIQKNLDGMFTCTPYNSNRIYQDMTNDKNVSESLNNILKLRNLFLSENVLAAYSYAMHLLNCPGNYEADYALPITEELKVEIFELMKQIKEV